MVHKRSSKKTRVLIVDDHAMLREGLAQLIDREEDLVVCAQAPDATTALNEIKQSAPDIAIVDITLGKMTGLQLTKIIATEYGKIPVLVLSMHDELIYAERALHAGARGYIMKEEAGHAVVTAIRRVMEGEIYLSAKASARVLHRLTGKGQTQGEFPIEGLTDRELEVFELIGQGFKTRQIGEKLSLSTKTIEAYREHIKNKLNLKNAGELVQAAIAWVHTGTSE